MRCPEACSARPARTVSTSGSSGIVTGAFPLGVELVVRHLRRLLLGPFLTRPAPRSPRGAVDAERRVESAGVIGACAIDVVLRGAHPEFGGEFLHAGLIVRSHPELGGPGEDRGDEPFDEAPGGLQAVGEV